jgi:hypothetical protein
MLLGLLVVACRAGSAPGTGPESSVGVPTVVTGRVITVGSDSAGVPQLYSESGPPTDIVGDLTREIHRLTGAQVTVLGSPGPANAIDVRSYAVLEVNGERPHVGVVIRRETGYALFLESGAVAIESNSEAPLEALLGTKIWALGPKHGERLRIDSYGVIRPR